MINCIPLYKVGATIQEMTTSQQLYSDNNMETNPYHDIGNLSGSLNKSSNVQNRTAVIHNREIERNSVQVIILYHISFIFTHQR